MVSDFLSPQNSVHHSRTEKMIQRSIRVRCGFHHIWTGINKKRWKCMAAAKLFRHSFYNGVICFTLGFHFEIGSMSRSCAGPDTWNSIKTESKIFLLPWSSEFDEDGIGRSNFCLHTKSMENQVPFLVAIKLLALYPIFWNPFAINTPQIAFDIWMLKNNIGDVALDVNGCIANIILNDDYDERNRRNRRSKKKCRINCASE